MRAYVQDAERLSGQVHSLNQAVGRLQGLGIEDHFVSVWSDPNQPHSDYGGLYSALVENFKSSTGVNVKETKGDLFVDALNRRLVEMRDVGCTHVLVLSPSAVQIITPALLDLVKEAVYFDEAKVVGVAHPDFPDLSSWSVTNTHCFWELDALIDCGGFDENDRRPADFDASIHSQGVWEAYTALKLSEACERPATAIIDTDESVGDTRTDAKHRVKIGNKKRRLDDMLSSIDMTQEEFAHRTLIEGYPYVLQS